MWKKIHLGVFAFMLLGFLIAVQNISSEIQDLAQEQEKMNAIMLGTERALLPYLKQK